MSQMESANEDHFKDHYHRSRTAVVITSREQELQKLLAEERVRSEQRKTNYSTLKAEHLKLQKDFLTLQSEMRQILEETKFIKDKKDNELENVLKVMEERDKVIEKLRIDMKERDPEVIKESFASELKEPLQRLEKSKEVLVRDKERLVYELKIAKQKIDYLEKDNIEGIERVRLTYEAEINLVKREKEELRIRLIEANQSPDVKRLTDLSQENAKLNARVKGFQTTLEDAELQYKKIQNRVEALVVEQENSEKEFEKQISSLNSQLTSLRDNNMNLRQMINIGSKEKEDLISEMERLKNEMNRILKDQEEKERLFLAEKDKIKRLSLMDFNELEVQKNNLLEELKKLKTENEAKSETISRLEQDMISKEKECQLEMIAMKQQEYEKRSAIEHDKNAIQSKLKDMKEEKSRLKEEMEQMKRQIENNCDLRLSVERDSMVLRAKLESYQINIEELEKLRRQHISLHEEMNKLKSENAQYVALNRDLVRQREQYKLDYNRIKITLEDERKQLEEFKVQSEKSLLKLRNCIEEERHDFRDQLLSLERDVLKYKKERDETKAKYRQYASIADKLQSKLKDMKEQQVLDKQWKHQNKSSQPIGGTVGTVSAEMHNQLKKELKSMKKKQNELSQLLNCTFDSTHCKEVTANQTKS